MTSHLMATEVKRMWGGRFASGPSAELDRLNRSLPVDRRLWRQDLAGSLAWCTALRQAGVLEAAEEEALRTGLHRVAQRLLEWDEAEWAAAPDEDVHSLVERLLGEEVGSVAGKLHTGRSRNDQVATDSRLWALAAIDALDAEVRALESALLEQAEAHVDTIMSAYTHLQRAQPVSAAHWLLSHVWPLERDRERLADARRRVGVLPLGSGAIAGCPFPVDRVLLKETLGFRDISRNSIDAVADRDWVAELLFTMSMIGIHMSRLAEDLIVFATSEFGFVRMSDAYSTGSSLMPQKRNPDALELARAKASRLIGGLTGILSTLKGLPSGYNKDLQEDKSALFEAVDTLALILPAVTGTVATMTIDATRCAAAVDTGMLLTDLADAMVEAGTPFREAHERVGALARAADETGVPLRSLPDDVLRAHLGDAAEKAVLATVLDARRSIARRTAIGGTADGAVRDQIATLGLRLLEARG
ncbi:MAG TPA: argininosuccinate lyase [Longimicrobiales bacterium]|nr:argininosuccinate lyase [Longimicrobiales bacterium]